MEKVKVEIKLSNSGRECEECEEQLDGKLIAASRYD